MLFGTLELGTALLIFAIFSSVFIVLNVFVFPNQILFNARSIKNKCVIKSQQKKEDKKIAVLEMLDETTAKYISKAVIVSSDLDIYLRCVTAQEFKSIEYEVIMFEQKQEDDVPFKRIVVKQDGIEDGMLDLVRLSEKTSTVSVKVLRVDGKKVSNGSIKKRDIKKFSFVFAIAAIPLSIVVTVIAFTMFDIYNSGMMIMWDARRTDAISWSAIFVPIIAYFATAGLTFLCVNHVYSVPNKVKGVKKNV